MPSFLMVASFPDSLLLFRGPLIDALSNQGIDVHVAAPDIGPDSSIRRTLESKGISVHEIALRRTGMNPVSDLQTFWMLYRLMRHIRPDTVMSYTIKPVIYGSLAAWLARIPHRYALVTGLGYAFINEGERGLLLSLVRSLYRLSLSRVNKVFFQNPDNENLFRLSKIISPRMPSHVVNGSGVDVSAYPDSPLPAGETRFLLIARLLGDKGVREYVEAARQVRMKHPQTIFRLVGWIDDNPDSITQHELDAWMAEGTIEFLGRLEDVRPAMADANVYVLPSYREGTPRTVLEAMAMGRAVITTDAPGCRETVIDGHNGYLVPVRSIDALASAMLRFIEQPELIPLMGQRSRTLAEKKYDVNKVNEILMREMKVADGQWESRASA